MNKKYFRTFETKVDFKVNTLSLEEFSEIIWSEKPSEIYHSTWNSKWNEANPQENAFVIITEYNEDGFLWFCVAHADKTPKQGNINSLYKWLKGQAMEDCYIVPEKPVEKILKSVSIKDGFYTSYYTDSSQETLSEEEYFKKYPNESITKIKLPTVDELKKLLHSCAKFESVEEGKKITRIFEKEAEAILKLISDLNQITPN